MSEFAPGEGVRVIDGYAIGKTLGTGMSAKVKLGTNQATGEQIALKCIDKSKLGSRQLEMLQREIAAMQDLQHPNILHLQHVNMNAAYPKKRGGVRNIVLLSLELGQGGELFEYLMNTGAFSEDVSRTYFRQLLSGLEQCHSQGIFHRDLKPENLLLDEHFQLKIADFGLASVQVDPDTLCHTECGTRSYMGPEVMSRQPYDGAKADIWSAGVVLFIMLAGNPPFQTATRSDWWFNAVSQSRYDKFWAAHLRTAPDFPKLAQDFLNHIFVANPAQRASIDDLWNHPWMQGTVMQPGELTEAMAAKHAEVERVKERELARARAQKARQARARGGTHNAFAKNTHRAVPPPTMPNVAQRRYTHFFSSEAPDALMQAVNGMFEELGAAAITVKQQDYKIKAVLPANEARDQLEVVALVYSVPDEPDMHILDFERRQGDQIDFMKLVRSEIYDKLKDVVVCDEETEEGAAVDDAAAAEAPVAADADAVGPF